MTSLGGDVDISGLSVQVDSKYFSIAILTWVVYELIITSDDTVNLFWMQRRSISKVLFFVDQPAHLIEPIRSGVYDDNYKCSQPPIPNTCAVLTGYQFVGTFLILGTETFMLATRVWALWRGSYIILSIYFLVVSANICNYLFTYGLALVKGTIFLKQSPYTGCWVNPRYNVTWIGVTSVLVFETLSIGLIICKSWLTRRVTGITTPIFSLLLEDGLAHYLLFIASKLFVVGGILVPTAVSTVALPAEPALPVAGLAVNRLFIRLRRTMLNQTPGVTEYTGFSTTKHSTGGGDDDGGKGITPVGGSYKSRRSLRTQRHSHLDGEWFSLGGGNMEMSLRKNDGELYPTASTLRCSTILLTPKTSGSLSNVDVSVLDSKPLHAV